MSKVGRQAALLVRAAGQLCAIPIGYVIETLRPLPIRPIQAVDDSVLGVSIIRGAPTVVIDASRLFGVPATAGRFVTLRAGSRIVALAVEEVIGVRELEAASLQPLPTLLAARSLDAIGASDAELLVVLGASHLIPDNSDRPPPPRRSAPSASGQPSAAAIRQGSYPDRPIASCS